VPGTRQSRRQLEEKGRLADARRPCQEDHRAGHQPAAEDAIDAREGGPDSGILTVWGKRDDDRRPSRIGARSRGGDGVFADGPPAATGGTATRPLTGRTATVTADVQLLELAHPTTIATVSDTPEMARAQWPAGHWALPLTVLRRPGRPLPSVRAG